MAVNLSILGGAGWQFFDNSGVPLAGGLLYTYEAGTTTPAPTYTTSAGTIANTNPIVLDAAGRTPSEVWLTISKSYKFVLKTSASVLIGTYDDITGIANFPVFFTSNYATFADALTAAAGKTLYVNSAITISSNTSIPKTTAIQMVYNGAFTIATNTTLTISGEFSAGLIQCFTYQGTGTVVFSGGVVSEVYPEWWGAVADSSTDNATAINNALSAIGSNTSNFGDQVSNGAYGGRVVLSRGQYNIASTINVKSYQWLDGNGRSSILYLTNTGAAAITMLPLLNTGTGAAQEWVQGARISNITLQGTNIYPTAPTNFAGNYGIYARRPMRCYIDNVWVMGFGDNGIYQVGGAYTYWQNCYVQYNAGAGIYLLDALATLGADNWLTDTRIENCTVRVNKGDGIVIENVNTGWVIDSTIEGNGLNGTGAKLAAGSTITADNYFNNIRLQASVQIHIQSCYLEHGGGYGTDMTKSQITIVGSGWYNYIDNCTFQNFIGTLFYSGAGGPQYTPEYCYVSNSVFSPSYNPNVYTLSGAAAIVPNSIYFDNCMLVRFQDSTGNVDNINLATLGQRKLLNGLLGVTGNIGYSPTYDYVNTASVTTGTPKPTVIQMTLIGNVVIDAPAGLAEGQECTFIFVQDAVGGHTVTWNAVWKNAWSNVGNTANKVSTIKHVHGSPYQNAFYQVGAQSTYY
jgi:hypothetical protein